MKRVLLLFLALSALLCGVSCETAQEEPDKNYVFQVGNVTVSVDDGAETILTALGQWKDYNESPSCAFEGLDKIYVYNGFRIQTYTLSGVDYIRSVELTDDSVSTPEGIAVGASAEAVLDAYGEPKTKTDSALVYENTEKGMKLQFILRDGKVTNIQYLKNI